MIGEQAALDPLQQPVGLIAGKIRLDAQAARAGLLAQRLGLVALGIVVGERRVLVLVHIAPFRRWISGPFKRSSEERREGKGGVSKCRFRWAPYHENTKKKNYNKSMI